MWVGKEKPSNSPAAEQQHLLIVRVPILAALTSRRWPDFSWQEVPVGLKSSETLPPVVKAKNCVPGRGAEEGSWAAEGGFGRQIGESGARHDGEQMGLHFHPPPHAPKSRFSEPPEREHNIWGFSGAGVCRVVLGFLRQILQICPIVFHVVGSISAAPQQRQHVLGEPRLAARLAVTDLSAATSTPLAQEPLKMGFLLLAHKITLVEHWLKVLNAQMQKLHKRIKDIRRPGEIWGCSTPRGHWESE